MSGSLGREYSNRDELNSVEMVDRDNFISKKSVKIVYKRSSDNNISQLKAYIRGLQAEAESLIFEKERYGEALKRYDEIIKMTENATDIELLKDFAGANFLKAHIYNSYLKNIENSILMYDIVRDKFESSSNKELLKLYYKAQKLKINLLDRAGKLEVYREIADRFENSRDDEFIEYYIYAQNNIALNSTREEAIDIYDRVIEKSLYSGSENIQKIVIDVENMKAHIQKDNGDIDGAIESYDDIIDRFGDNDIFYKDVSDAIFNKSYLLSEIDKKDVALDVLDDLIDREKSRDNIDSENFKYSVINALELAIVSDVDDSRYSRLIEENLRDDREVMAEYDMLNILKDAQYGEQDDRMREWREKNPEYSFESWDFTNLEEWSSSLDDVEAKERVKRYLNEFREGV